VSISPDVVDPDDVEMLEDLVVAAVTEALRARRSCRPSRWVRSPEASTSVP